MSLIVRDMLVEDALDRIDALESALRDLQDYSSIPPAVTPDEPGWSAFSGWVVTGLQLQDLDGYIVLDPSIPAIEINDDTGLQAQLGYLGDIVDADLSPSGYGLYSANVFLKGDLHAASGSVVIDTSGITIKADTDLATLRIKFVDGDAGTSYELGSIGVARAVSNAAMSISTKPREVADAYSYMTLSVNKYSGGMRAADLTLLYDYISIDNYANDRDLRINGGIYLGAVDTDPTKGQLWTTGDVRVGAGLRIGDATTDPYDDDLSVAGGITVGYHADPTAGRIIFTEDLHSRKASTNHAVYAFHPLTTGLTSLNWDGDSKSDTSGDPTLLDFDAVGEFGASIPANAKALYVMLDAVSSNADDRICFTPENNRTTAALQSRIQVANQYGPQNGIIPLNSGAEAYWWTEGTLDVYMVIWGYFI